MFAERGIPEAIRLGRKALYNDKNRKVYFNQVVELEDWLLPVVYANKAVDLRLQPFTPEQEEAYFAGEDERYRFAQPTYSFVGRDLEILKIEKALLRHNVLLLQGMGGTGKTTLLNYLRDWWQRTNFAADVFYFGYDEKAHTLQQILQAIGKRVLSKFEFASFGAMGLGAQRRKLAEVLRAKPYAIVLDNLESVTGEPLAIPNTLPESEQTEIKAFLQALVGGQTKVVLGSRSDEAWLKDVFTFAGKVNRYQLRGLDAEARTVLAEKILASTTLSHREIENIRKEKNFERLMTVLAGYPLAMEVVLTNLGRQSAAEVLAGLDAADVDLDSGEADKTKSILKCVEYSHSNLSAAAQKLLLCLAPFKGFIYREVLPNYVEELKKLEPFADWEFDRFEAAVDEAMRWGLLSPYFDGDDGRLLRIQPVFPYFLKAKLADVDAAVHEGLATGFKEHYRGLAAQYEQMMDSKEPEQRKLGVSFCGLEYENLFSALQTSLQRRENPTIFWCLQTYLMLNQDKRAELSLLEFVDQSLKEYVLDTEPEIQIQIICISGQKASLYLELQRYLEARESCQALIHFIENSKVDPQGKQSLLAGIYHQLGMVAQELKEYEQARLHFQQALNIRIEYNDHYSQASTYHHLGMVAQELREYEQAKLHYQKSLDIYIEYNDRYSQAKTYHQLGGVAQELREHEKAKSHYQQALDICVEYNDRYSQATIYHQLGNFYHTLREFEDARESFQKALDIRIDHGNRVSQSIEYHGLGMVAEALREYEQARLHYQKSLDIYIEYNDRYSQAKTYHQLGGVAQELREYEKAKSHYQESLDIDIEYNDRYSQASTYHNLGSVARELREYEQARAHYQQALDICIEFNDRYSQASTYHQLGRVAEELREYEQARAHFLTALETFVKFEDKHSGGIVLRGLYRLHQVTQDNTLLPEVAQCLNSTVEEVAQLFEQFDPSA